MLRAYIKKKKKSVFSIKLLGKIAKQNSVWNISENKFFEQ